MHTIEEIMARLTEIRSLLDGDLTNVDVAALQAEVTALNEERAQLEQRAAAARELRASIANAPASQVIASMPTANEAGKHVEVRNTMEYMEAYARALITGDDSECRSLLSVNAPAPATGSVEVPDYVEERIRTAWERDQLMRFVSRSFVKGNLKIGFEISGTDAVVHAEGSAAVTEENLVLGYVTLVPQSIKKWIRVSDEVLDLKGQEFIDYVYDELAYRIVQKAAAIAIASILAMPQASSATQPAVAAITEALGAGTIVDAGAEITSEAVNVVAIMNKKTRAALRNIQIASGTNVGDVFDGLDVVLTDALKSYAAASSGDPYMIVGDLSSGIRANFPNGDEIKIKTDDMTEMTGDMVRILGRMYAGIGVVAPLRFCKVLKP
jgi:HK97 family phage major capsid protein